MHIVLTWIIILAGLLIGLTALSASLDFIMGHEWKGRRRT